MNLIGDTKYESIFYEDDALTYQSFYMDARNGVAYRLFKPDTQGPLQPLEFEQYDLEGNLLSTFSPTGFYWQQRNCTAYFDVESQTIVHEVQILDSEFINQQSYGSSVVCIVVIDINKDDFANSEFFLINKQTSPVQTSPPYGNPDENYLWRFDGINKRLGEIYYSFGGNTSKISWGIVEYDRTNVIDNLNMVSRVWGNYFRTSSPNLFYIMRSLGTSMNYEEKTAVVAAEPYVIRINYDDGSYLVNNIDTNTVFTRQRQLVKGKNIVEVFATGNSKVYIFDEDLNVIDESDWDYENGIYFKQDDPSAYVANPIRTTVIEQVDKSNSLISGEIVSGEQDDKTILFKSEFDEVNLFRISAEQQAFLTPSLTYSKILDEYRGANLFQKDVSLQASQIEWANFNNAKTIRFNGDVYNTGVPLKGKKLGFLFTWERGSPNTINRMWIGTNSSASYIGPDSGYRLVFSFGGGLTYNFNNLGVDAYDANIFYAEIDFENGTALLNWKNGVQFLTGLSAGIVDNVITQFSNSGNNGWYCTEYNIFNLDSFADRAAINAFINPKANAIASATGLTWNNLT